MGSVNLVVIVEAARALITKSNDELENFHLPSIIGVAAALGMTAEHLACVSHASITYRRQISAFLVFIFVKKQVKSSTGPVGRSQKRFIYQWFWYVNDPYPLHE